MNAEALRRHRRTNATHSALLVGTMAGLAAVTAHVLFGMVALVLAVAGVLVLFLGSGRIAPGLVLSAYRARPIPPHVAPALWDATAVLARRADLPRSPQLWYLPSDVMNAFALGTPGRSAIALSDGILRRLNLDEVVGVVAHEVSHVANLDTRLLGFADLTTRLTTGFAHLGWMLLLVTLPLQLFGVVTFSLLVPLLLLAAPALSTLAQLALSRTREFDADRSAAELLGDPRPLAQALRKVEVWNGSMRRRIGQALPGTQLPEASLLRSHPPTAERIARLAELVTTDRPRAVPWPSSAPTAGLLSPSPIRPRWHRTTTWF